jgi:tetratricopeptide (TPR) repeat protein
MTKKTGEKTKEGWAKVILAACYESSNDINLAVSYLQQYLTTAENDPAQKAAASQACNQLGRLFNTLGKYKESVQYYELHYRLCVDIEKEKNASHKHHHHHRTHVGERHIVHDVNAYDHVYHKSEVKDADAIHNELRLAMIQLGMARANAQMEDLFRHVQTNDTASLATLLQWKGSKTKSSHLLRPEEAPFIKEDQTSIPQVESV